MDIEAQEKIADILTQNYSLVNIPAVAAVILKELWELGYCKLPKDKPPLLSKGESMGADYDANCGQLICCDILPQYLKSNIEDCYIEISKVIEEFVDSQVQAQWEADIKFYGGE